MCPPGSVLRQRMKKARANQTHAKKKKSGMIYFGRERDVWEDWGKGGEERTFDEVALLDAELAYAGTEPEEGEAEDGAEQCHGGRSIGRVAPSMLKRGKSSGDW